MMPNYKDEWPLHVRWPFRVLFLGWWLTGQFGMSGGQYQLKPSISVSPGVVVPVGENVTIRCKREERYRPAEFTLYKEVSGSRRYVGTKMVEGDEATFQIIHAQPSDAGTYCCRFRSEHYQQWSDYSYKVHIKIKGLVYHKPIISMNPKEQVPLGADVTIQCKSTRYRPAEYYLLKEGSPEPTQMKRSDWEEVVFSIANVTLSDGGIYWCEYRDSSSLGDQYSQASDQVYLHVTDPGLAKPLIKMEPKGHHVLGAIVTIHCQGPEKGLTFFLYKSMDLVYSQIAKPDNNATTFSILVVRPEYAGSYTCHYQGKGNPFVWSEPSVSMKLVVKDPHLAKPLIQMEPKGPHFLGANVIIYCKGPEKGLTFFLYRSMDCVASQIAKPESNTSTFSILMVRPEDAGSYTCQYHGQGKPFVWSEPSASMKLVVKDPHLGNPLIKMEPKGPHSLDTNITIHCQGPEKGLTFFLYKSMDLVHSQIAKPDSNATTFSILVVRPEDAGSYTCQYHGKGNPFVWSEPTVPMKLVVKEDSQVNHASLSFASVEVWIRLGVGIVVLLALVLILAEATYSGRPEQHFWNIN